MDWKQFVEWTDTTAMPSNDSWDALRAGLIEECHEALAIWHQIKAMEFGAVKRLHRDGAPDAMRLEVRQTKLDRLRRQLVEEVGDACWYAARVVRLAGGNYTVLLGGCPVFSREALTRMLENPWKGEADGDWWATDLLSHLLAAMDVRIDEAIADNVAKLTARKVAGTIQGEGDR